MHRVELLQGFLHDSNTLQHAFLHKSSIPQFHIPFNSTKLPSISLANHYTFTIHSHIVKDFDGQSCNAASSTDSKDQKNCYISYMEERLNCSLQWIYFSNQTSGILRVQSTIYKTNELSSSLLACQLCQFPFIIDGHEYDNCTTNGGSLHPWCATSIRRDRTLSDPEISWQFCPDNCSSSYKSPRRFC